MFRFLATTAMLALLADFGLGRLEKRLGHHQALS